VRRSPATHTSPSPTPLLLLWPRRGGPERPPERPPSAPTLPPRAAGRDLSGNKRTAPQSSDQQLEGSNLALAVSMWRKLPLRVVRGFKSQEKEFAPAEGYRYDGLYDVVNVWPEIGESGFVIWRYHLKRREGQAPCPWEVPGWREAEAAEIARLKREQGDAPLIPLGSGTTVLGVAPKRRGGKSAGDDGAAKRGKSSV